MSDAPIRGPLGAHAENRQVRAPVVVWGVVWGGIQAASPLAFWWLDAATVYALGLVLIAAFYIGFAVADGRWLVIAFETNIAAIFVLVAAAAVTQSPWLLIALAFGMLMLVELARRRTDQPQSWALFPAVGIGLAGLALLVLGPKPGSGDIVNTGPGTGRSTAAPSQPGGAPPT